MLYDYVLSEQVPDQEDDINQRIECLEHQSEVNQYNTCTLRELHALTSLETRRVPKAEDLIRVATKVNVTYV